MRRAAISVPANIAEGAARNSKREYLQFLSIAQGSLSELLYYVRVSKHLGYLPQDTHALLTNLGRSTAELLGGLTRSIRKEIAPPTIEHAEQPKLAVAKKQNSSQRSNVESRILTV